MEEKKSMFRKAIFVSFDYRIKDGEEHFRSFSLGEDSNFGEDYGETVGIFEHEAKGTGDNHYVDVYFKQGRVERIFDIHRIVYDLITEQVEFKEVVSTIIPKK